MPVNSGNYISDGDNNPQSGDTNPLDDCSAGNSGSEKGRVWINPTQYFDGVPLTAWNFYIGGYQPAQKWFKDRAGRTLSFDDIMHYQLIIKVLVMTNDAMKKIEIK